jgi:hypothetical protein
MVGRTQRGSSRGSRKTWMDRMAAFALARQQPAPEIIPPAGTREEILRRYRRLREINKRINDGLLELVPGNAIVRQARRLGLAHGRTLLLDSMDQMPFLFDLAIYTAPPDRTRAIDRYARAARLQPESDEARVLDAMRNARFALCVIERRHETAGLVLRDLLRDGEFWLVDEGLERTINDGEGLATRVFTPDAFSMTCGVMMPVDAAIMEDVFDEVLPRLKNRTVEEVSDDRRFAEAIYRTAMACGVMDEIGFEEPPETGS